ncbi:MAG TPA: hypothetical protein VFZ21_07170 [Gemmatimonadaceae bacterium]|jgi:hypothetical protein|nr:hypothetical protein [Gemmatimonadaceae bacterium]
MISTLSAAVRHARPPSFRRAALVLFAGVLTGAVGCGGGDSPTQPQNSPYGEYALRQIDGAAPPVQVHNGPWLDRGSMRFYNNLKLRVTGGEVHLHDDGTFYVGLELSGVGDGEQVADTMEYEAAFKLIDGELILIAEGQRVPIGTVEDGEVTFGFDLMGKGVFNQLTFRR